MTSPTYQELIELLEKAEKLASEPGNVLSTAEILTTNFSCLYPHIKIGRPTRFLETVNRINAPIVKGSLDESSRESYLRKEWTPRTRNPGPAQSEESHFPVELTHNYGLTIEFLSQIFQATAEAQYWSLHGIPPVLFYRKLHTFLKTWNTTRSLQKTSIGRFYLSIDSQLQARNSTPCNTYRFIERIVNSDLPDSTIMPYGTLDKASVLQAEINSCNEHIQVLDKKLVQQQLEIEEMKRDIALLRKQS